MKLSFLLTCLCCIGIYANTYAQSINLETGSRGKTVLELLNDIENQTQYRFFYNSKFADLDKVVISSFQNKNIDEVLSAILDQTAVSYKILDDNFIIITPLALLQQGIQITGTVTDESGEPMPGVNVVIKGTTTGVVTGYDGKYIIRVPDGNAVLIFSFMGYISQELAIGDQTGIDIILNEDTQEIEEVVVVGYGVQKRLTMSSAVASVKGGELSALPAPRFSASIGGKVSGIITFQESGAPGYDNATIYVRGSEPLILVDGVERPGDRINKEDIESVSVLKDAAAVAPYGLKGANGVILITTKRGTAGKISATYNGEVSWQKPMRTPDFMNSADYFEFRNKAFDMDGLSDQKMSDEEIEKYRNGTDPDQYPDTDWIGNYMKTSMATKHNLSVTGGTEKIRAFVSLGYLNQGSMFEAQNYNRYTLRSNIDIQATSTTKVSIDNSFLKDIIKYGGMGSTAIMDRLYRAVTYEVDRFSNGLSAFQSSNGISLYEYIHNGGDFKDQNDISTSSIVVEQQFPFIPGLSGKVSFNYDKQHKDQKTWVTPYVYYQLTPEGEYEKIDMSTTVKPTLNQQYKRWDWYTFNSSMNYSNTFGKHQIGVLALFEARWTEASETYTGKSETDFLIPELNTGTTDRTKWSLSGTSNKTAQYGVVGRINYNFNQKYMIELAGRYDEIYKYAPGRRGAFFPSMSIGWRISEESFMNFMRESVDNLKIRVSYGKSGNPVGDAYAYMNFYNIGSSYLWGTNGSREQGIYSTVESNPYLTWETVTKTDIGFDLNMWAGLFGIEFDYYYEKRKDKILAPNADVPTEYGISLADENAGIDARWGVDITLTNYTKISNDMNIHNSFVFSHTRHQLIENHENQGTLYNPRRRQTGLASSQIWGYKAVGLFTDEEEIKNWAFQDRSTKPGDIKYVDINKDGKIDSEDIVHIGRAMLPEIMWGYNLRVNWKNFELGLFFQGTGRSNYYLGTADRNVRRPFLDGIARTDHYGSWTTDNPDPNAEFPRLRSANFAMNYVTSDFWVINSSYVKLKSIDVAYNLEQQWIKRTGMSNLRIYANFFNVWTIFSKASKDFDPEAQRYTAYPQQFISTIGLTATF